MGLLDGLLPAGINLAEIEKQALEAKRRQEETLDEMRKITSELKSVNFTLARIAYLLDKEGKG